MLVLLVAGVGGVVGGEDVVELRLFFRTVRRERVVSVVLLSRGLSQKVFTSIPLLPKKLKKKRKEHFSARKNSPVAMVDVLLRLTTAASGTMCKHRYSDPCVLDKSGIRNRSV